MKSMEQLLQKLDQWCDGHDRELEVIVNDWGLAGLVGRMTSHLIPVLGILLNKYKKDPRIGFKQGDQMLLRIIVNIFRMSLQFIAMNGNAADMSRNIRKDITVFIFLFIKQIHRNIVPCMPAVPQVSAAGKKSR